MFGFGKPKQVAAAPVPAPRRSFFSTHGYERIEPTVNLDGIMAEIKRAQPIFVGDFAQDDASDGFPAFKGYNQGATTLSDALVMWYASQGFIGHQLAGIIAQNWLVNKACSMPVDDAIRKGFNIVTSDGDELAADALKVMLACDKRYQLKAHMREFLRKGRIFGIRIAMFKVESTDPQYYEKPFNLDGVAKGSYKGIVQIDPYWTAPQLDLASASKPDSLHFYEPTFWLINGQKVHRSHLVIFRHAEPIDILKPQYLYGGVPLPQQIMERVYAAERVANEAPELVQTKRTNVWLTDMEKVMADTDTARDRLNDWVSFRDNYGVKLGDKQGDAFQQFDTSLNDLDVVIMTQYQIVAAIACVPATKLLGTSPKGFGASGDYEIDSYHEFLESMQAHDLTPLVERHHALVMRSEVGLDIETTINWNPLDTPRAKERAEINLIKAQTGAALVQSGAITRADENQRVATDQDSGYHGLGMRPCALEGSDAAVMDMNEHHDPKTGQFTSAGGGGSVQKTFEGFAAHNKRSPKFDGAGKPKFENGTVYPAKYMKDFFDEQVKTTSPKDETHMPDVMFQAGHIDDKTAKALEECLPDFHDNLRDLRVSGRTIKHVYDVRPTIAQEMIEKLSSGNMMPSEVLPNPQDRSRALLVFEGLRPSSPKSKDGVMVVEVAANGKGTDMVSLMTVKQDYLNKARAAKGVK